MFINEHKQLVDSTYSVGDQSEISRPLDNQAYKLYLNGAYKFTPTTQATLKLAYTLGIQDEEFPRNSSTASTRLGGNTQDDLNGKVDTMLMQLGVSSRPIEDLTLRAKYRILDRRDNTQVRQWVSETNTKTGFNQTHSRNTQTLDLEANYRLPDDYRVTTAFEYEHWRRASPARRTVSWRDETDEVSARLQLDKTLTETLGGSLAYIISYRQGEDYQRAGLGANADPANVVDPIHWSNRERHKARLSMDWAPIEKLSLQATFDGSKDAFEDSSRPLGVQDGMSNNIAVDATYELMRYWNLTAWASRSEATQDQTQVGESGALQGSWEGHLSNVGYAAGLGLRGEPVERLKIGSGVQFTHDVSEFEVRGATFGNADLPDIVYRQWKFNLFADYQFTEHSAVKFNYDFTHNATTDWTWQNFLYDNDGTYVNLPERENAHFIGLSYRYRW